MDKTSEHIFIRKFERDDIETVTDILQHSFSDKFRLMKLSDEKMAGLFKEAGFVQKEPHPGYFVAQKGHEVMGVMLLKWKGQNRVKSSDRVNMMRLGFRYGFMNLSKLLFIASILSRHIREDECYIEHIAVKATARGLGIGTLLLDEGKRIAMSLPAVNHYTLNVAANNQGALRLYQNLGFKTKKRENSFITQLLFQQRSWLYMVNSIKNSGSKTRYYFPGDWWLGFLGFIGFFRIPSVITFLQGEGSPAALLYLLWFLWFLYFIPRKN